jgi:hypothetical protein
MREVLLELLSRPGFTVSHCARAHSGHRTATMAEPELLAADMRSRAGHYEVLGETYAKFEFFEKGGILTADSSMSIKSISSSEGERQRDGSTERSRSSSASSSRTNIWTIECNSFRRL